MGPLGFEPRTDGLKVTSSRFILAILALPSATSKTPNPKPLRLANICPHNHDHLSSHVTREWSFEGGSRRVTRRIAVIRVDRGVLRRGLRNATL